MKTNTENTFDIDWVVELARQAGDIGLTYYRHTTSERKADHTVVTEADRAIENFLVAEIQHHYPDDGILGEENANSKRQARCQWILDPIDGTSMFAAGLPVWCVSIGYMVDGELRAGVVYLPVIGDCFVAGLDGPATCNDEPIAVAPPGSLDSESMIMASSDTHLVWETDFVGKIRGLGSCAAHGCYVARGSAMGAVNTYTALWDIAGVYPILQRAGGTITLFDGSPLPLSAMLDGSKAPQPILMASPANAAIIRQQLQRKQTV